MKNKKITPAEHKITFEEEFYLKKDEEIIFEHRAVDAAILYPSFCNPAVVKKEDVKTTLELLVLCKKDDLQRGEAAFHLRYTDWDKKDQSSIYHKDYIWKNYNKDKESVVVSKPYEINDETFGEGDKSPDAEENDGFTLKLGHLNIFPWVLEKGKDYKYVYKVAITMNNTAAGMYNVRWLTYDDYHGTKNKPEWWDSIQHVKDLIPDDYKKELKEYDNVEDEDNIKAFLYHPFYISTKEELDIGHITDVHLDTRMDLYGQVLASVLEVEENKITIKDNDRVIKKPDLSNLCTPLKKVVSNFNESFMEISAKLLDKSDILVITGDLIDYNKGMHTDQTQKIKAKKPGEVWDELEAGTVSFDTENNKEDRNWFMFYKYVLQLYNKHKKPIFTMLGNHDYVKHAQAPWPIFGALWNGVYDMNLTLYENALCYGQGFSDDKEFVFNMDTSIDYVKWYTYYMNPFADYVVNYGDQTLFMVDWGEDGAMITPAVTGQGGLHHPVNVFGKGHKLINYMVPPYGAYKSLTSPFPIKNYSIYESWINSKPKIKMLFMHATAICPQDNVSTGEAAFDLKWTDDELQYGSFDNKRKEVFKDIEKGKLHIVLTGHSHRNMLFEVKEGCNHYPIPIGSEEVINTDFINPSNLVLITSSGGPLPKYLPGGPKICGCQQNNKYNTGFFVEGVFSKKLYQYKGDIDKALYITDAESKVRGSHLKSYIGKGDKAICPHCHMEAGNMVDKKPRRHKPGGNLLLFHNGKVKVRTEVSALKQNIPRKAVMCEEQDVFVDNMVVEEDTGGYDGSKKKYITNSTSIISQKAFKYYGYMEFPYKVEYMTYQKPSDKGIKGLMRGGPTPHNVKLVPVEDNKYKIRQGIGKKELDVLIKTARNQKDYIFTRYKFKTNEIWDREIKVKDLSDLYKKVELTDEARARLDPEVVIDIEKNLKYQRSPGHSVSDIVGGHSQKRDVIIQFVKTPDFKKRRNVCGY